MAETNWRPSGGVGTGYIVYGSGGGGQWVQTDYAVGVGPNTQTVVCQHAGGHQLCWYVLKMRMHQYREIIVAVNNAVDDVVDRKLRVLDQVAAQAKAKIVMQGMDWEQEEKNETQTIKQILVGSVRGVASDFAGRAPNKVPENTKVENL